MKRPNRPRISILLPTRNRPEQFLEMYQSAMDTADGPIEFVIYIDNDDNSYDDIRPENACRIYGERIVLSKMWNRCQEEARADVFLHAGDDLRFRTPGWDTKILEAFPEDKIAFVHGRDGSPQDQICFGTHGFIHRKWVDAVGYFVPPYFSCDFNDTWLNDVSNDLDRHIFVEDVLIEHLHYVWGKRQKDDSDTEREQRGQRDNVRRMYDDMADKRRADVEKLRKLLV